MWYALAKQNSVWSAYDGKILKSSAENAVRELLYLRGDYSPEKSAVAKYVEKTLNALQEKYGNSDKLRIAMRDEHLMPAVKEAAREVFQKKKR